MPNENKEEWRVRMEMLERKIELLHRRLAMVEARPTTWASMSEGQYERQRDFDNSWSWPPDDATMPFVRRL